MKSLHDRALIIDGLNFHGDGDPGVLKNASITAVNMTVSHFEADFEEALDGMARWLAVLRQSDQGWRLVRRAGDIEACHADGVTGLIMGWQNLRPVADNLDRLVLFHDLGLRVAQLTYNGRNLLGDGCLETEDGGLTSLGREGRRHDEHARHGDRSLPCRTAHVDRGGRGVVKTGPGDPCQRTVGHSGIAQQVRRCDPGHRRHGRSHRHQHLRTDVLGRRLLPASVTR